MKYVELSCFMNVLVSQCFEFMNSAEFDLIKLDVINLIPQSEFLLKRLIIKLMNFMSIASRVYYQPRFNEIRS